MTETPITTNRDDGRKAVHVSSVADLILSELPVLVIVGGVPKLLPAGTQAVGLGTDLRGIHFLHEFPPGSLVRVVGNEGEDFSCQIKEGGK